MISLKQLREYFEGLVERVDGLKQAVPLTIEANMADKVNSIGEEESPVLFYLPPSSEGAGSIDAFNDRSACVIFIMKKYTPRRSTSAAVLEDTQPVAEEVKAALLEDSRRPCHFLKADIATLSTMPETEFFGNWAGWSVAFTVDNYVDNC